MSVPVLLYVYDLSNGVAKNISPFLLGRRIEGVWHTAVVVYGNEYFYGGHGIACCVPGTTQLGQPLKKENLGMTSIPQNVFEEYLLGNSNSKFHGASYNLLHNNCNNFSDEVAKFLTGNGIDENIVNLPQKVLSSPMGPLIRPHLEKMSNVAPTDGSQTRHLHQEQASVRSGSNQATPTTPGTPDVFGNNNGNHSNGYYGNGGYGNGLPSFTSGEHSSVLYVPEFCTVELSPGDIEVLQEVNPLLPTIITRGPLSGDDLPMLCTLHLINRAVFCTCVSLLCQKSGFIRLILGDSELLKLVKQEIPSNLTLMNNLLAGLNQAEREVPSGYSCIVFESCVALLLDPDYRDLSATRLAYNLGNTNLNEDEIIQLGSALLSCLSDKFILDAEAPSPDKNETSETDSGKGRASPSTEVVENLRLILKGLYTIMLKNRQVAELSVAMDIDFGVYRTDPGLGVVVLKIDELVASSS